MESFREFTADLVMVLYLSMTFIEQKSICCMTRVNHNTVQKIQETVRTVKAIHRSTWDEGMLKIGGFLESDEEIEDDEGSADGDDTDDSVEVVARPQKKPKTNEPVIAGKEYPHLLGRK